MRALIAANYEKKFDAESKTWFYFNKKTGESHWTQPPGLYNGADIAISSRTAAAAKEAGLEVDDSNVFESKAEPVMVKQRTFVKPHEKRYTAADLSDEEAALIVQGAYRSKKAREKMRALIAANYVKKFDPASKSWFYFNKKTGESHWTQPPGLYNGADIAISSRTAAAAKEAGLEVDDSNVFESKAEPVMVKQRTFVKPHEKRYTAADLSDEEAALIVQGAYRSKKAREKMRALIAANYVKKFDPASKSWFYFNKKTGESHWTQPPGLYNGADIAISSRTAAAANEAGLEVDDSNVFESKVEERKPKERKRRVKHHKKRYTAADLSDHDAALIIQQAFRAKKARHRFYKMITKRWAKKYDTQSKRFFYYNKETKETQWDPPFADLIVEDIQLSARTSAMAGIPYVVHHTPRFTAASLTPDEAARHIQSVYRAKQSRKMLKKILREVYVKKFSLDAGKYFYYNKNTKESFWEKPVFLGMDDIPVTPRTQAAARNWALDLGIKPEKVKTRTPRFTHKTLSKEEAALHIQGIWRARKARRLLRRMIADVYEKKFDEGSGTWFYFNRKTGESHWEKPLGLQSDDINVSSRTADVAKKHGINIKQENIFVRKKTADAKPREKRYSAADLSDGDAAIVIQQAFRRKMARRRLHQIANKSYKKCFDPTTKRVFYYNLKSQQSFWEKPGTLPDDDDLKLTLEAKKLAIEAKAIVPPKPKTPRFTAETLSDEEAALHIQGIWRARKARKLLRKMIADVYVKKYDHESKKILLCE